MNGRELTDRTTGSIIDQLLSRRDAQRAAMAPPSAASAAAAGETARRRWPEHQLVWCRVRGRHDGRGVCFEVLDAQDVVGCGADWLGAFRHAARVLGPGVQP